MTDDFEDDYDYPELDTRVLVELDEMVGAMLDGIGGGNSPVDAMASAAEFVEHHRLKFDGKRYDLDPDGRYCHLRDPFEDTHPKKVAMAGAQTGKTGWLMANLVRDMAGPAWGQMMGYYFPDAHLPIAFARDRFKPFMRSNPELGQHLGAPQTSRGGKGVDNELTMSWGETVLFFMTIAGNTATEGLPLKAIYFDEVRKMDMRHIGLAEERTSAQSDPINFKVSTARFPESDIHHYFLEGDQRYFHSACKCPEGCVLSLTFPKCIADLRSADSKLVKRAQMAFKRRKMPPMGIYDKSGEVYPAVYMCPKCGEIIANPRDGWWEAAAPQNWAHSYQFPQMLSWTYPAAKMLYKIEHAKSESELYNSGAGLPYIDSEAQKLRPEQLAACVNSDAQWGEHMTDDERARRVVNTGMGVDVQKGYLVAVIKQPTLSGKHRTVHLEVVTHPSGDHWERLGEIMERYDVACAIVDAAPEINAARVFANAFFGRVWLQDYTLGEDSLQMVQWPEDTLEKDKKAKDPTEFPLRVRMSRTQVLEMGVMRWANRQNEVPNPRTLVQILPRQKDKVVLSPDLRQGIKAPSQICAECYFDHLWRWAFVDLLEEDLEKKQIGAKKRVAQWIGLDPHFSHADTWASIACGRLAGRYNLAR